MSELLESWSGWWELVKSTGQLRKSHRSSAGTMASGAGTRSVGSCRSGTSGQCQKLGGIAGTVCATRGSLAQLDRTRSCCIEGGTCQDLVAIEYRSGRGRKRGARGCGSCIGR